MTSAIPEQLSSPIELSSQLGAGQLRVRIRSAIPVAEVMGSIPVQA